jgi:hypothetical protein
MTAGKEGCKMIDPDVNYIIKTFEIIRTIKQEV